MLRIIGCGLLVCGALAIGSTQVRAASIGPDCATCQGSTYTLDIVRLLNTDLNKADNLFDTYAVTLTIDTAGYTGGGVRIDEVAVKISSGVDKATLTGAPGDLSYWTILAGGISAGGCSGTGSGFECSDWIIGSTGGAYVPNVNKLTWTFNIDISGPVFDSLSADPNLLPSIKVRYVDDNDKKVGDLVSEKVPEPTTLGLFAAGLLVAGVQRRRR